MMMITKQSSLPFVLFFGMMMIMMMVLMMAKTAQAKTYSIALNYLKTGDNADCAGYEDTIQSISEQALLSAGVDQAGNSDNWKLFDNNGYGNGNGNGNSNGNKNRNANSNPDKDDDFRLLLEEQQQEEGHDHDADRELGGCDDTCRNLCLTSGHFFYCDCCSCCGNGRRRRHHHGRRVLKNVSPEKVEKVRDECQTHAVELLKALEEPIPCLRSDNYYVVVVIG